MISIKGHIKILREGQEPLDLTEYVQDRGFPELTFGSTEQLVEWIRQRETEAERGEVTVAL